MLFTALHVFFDGSNFSFCAHFSSKSPRNGRAIRHTALPRHPMHYADPHVPYISLIKHPHPTNTRSPSSSSSSHFPFFTFSPVTTHHNRYQRNILSRIYTPPPQTTLQSTIPLKRQHTQPLCTNTRPTSPTTSVSHTRVRYPALY